LLEKQHRLVEKLFKQFESAKTPQEKQRIFEQIAANLVAHDAIEREIFYPACERELGRDDENIQEALVEHGLVEFALFTSDKGRREAFESHVTALKEVVMHHVHEEENELLPKAKRAIKPERLEALGVMMEKQFSIAMEKDFRKPLRVNLMQVIDGKLKPAPAKVRSAVKRRTATTTRKRTAA
jgi:hypothetical protein